MKVKVVSALTGSDSLDVLEDRGSVVFDSRTEALSYLTERAFDAALAIVEAEDAL